MNSTPLRKYLACSSSSCGGCFPPWYQVSVTGGHGTGGVPAVRAGY